VVLTPTVGSMATAGLATGTAPPVELRAAAVGKHHDSNEGDPDVAPQRIAIDPAVIPRPFLVEDEMMPRMRAVDVGCRVHSC
jgi:hypothetical protein